MLGAQCDIVNFRHSVVQQISNIIYLAQVKVDTCWMATHYFTFPSPHPPGLSLAFTILFSVSMGLATFNTSLKWYYAALALLWLAFVTYNNVFPSSSLWSHIPGLPSFLRWHVRDLNVRLETIKLLEGKIREKSLWHWSRQWFFVYDNKWIHNNS